MIPEKLSTLFIQDMLMTASPNGSNIMSQLSGSPNNVSDYYQHKGEVQPIPVAGLASTAFYDQVSFDKKGNKKVDRARIHIIWN